MSKKREIFLGLVLLLVAIILFFIILEIVVRLFFPVSDTIWTGDPIIGHKHIPNKSGLYVILEHTSEVKFNSEGFRDIDHKIENPENKYRIAMLGDSAVDALEVDFDSSFHQLFQKELNEKSPDKYEIFNFGLYQFSTAQEFLTYKYFIEKYKPDEIYLLATSNDPYENCLPDAKNPAFYLENGTIKPYPFSPNNYSSLELFLSKHFKSLVFLRKQYYTLLNKAKQEEAFGENNGRPYLANVYMKNYTNQTEQCWEITFYFIKELKKEAESTNSSLKVLILPQPISLYPSDRESFLADYNLSSSDLDFEKPQIIFENMLQKEKIDYINLEPFFRKSKERLHYNADGHLNPFGHKFLANILLENLKN